MQNTFGQFLSQKRKEVGLTQKQLGEKLYVSESTVSKWEKDKSNPDISMITQLATILQVSEHELITASEDKTERKTKKDARKWQKLATTWDLFFIISYGLALLTCFICNLAIDKKLSWFWIVFSAILLSASFTTFPKFIKKYKLLLVSLCQLLCLILLLGVCCVWTNGTWFWLATFPCFVAFGIVFLPIYFSHYNVPQFFKQHNALISIVIDIVLLILMLLLINNSTSGNWFGFALKMTLYTSIIPLSFVVVCRYLKASKLLKSSILTFIFVPFLIGGYFITKSLVQKTFGVKIDEIVLPNFLDWSTSTMISSNVAGIIILCLIAVSIIFLLIHFVKKTKNKSIQHI